MELAKSFEPKEIEARWYPIWENSGYFKAGLDPDRLQAVMVGLNHGCWSVDHRYEGQDVMPLVRDGKLRAFAVTSGGEVLGRVCDVQSTGGCDLWVVRSRSGQEHLIPAAAAICTRVDVEGGRITIDPPAGLLELNAI